eukprot:jgi/Mesvir1/27467/Mv26387-RA.1
MSEQSEQAAMTYRDEIIPGSPRCREQPTAAVHAASRPAGLDEFLNSGPTLPSSAWPGTRALQSLPPRRPGSRSTANHRAGRCSAEIGARPAAMQGSPAGAALRPGRLQASRPIRRRPTPSRWAH